MSTRTRPNLAYAVSSIARFTAIAVSLLDTMQKLESVTKKLQDPKLTMSDVKVLFDFVIDSFPGMSHYLSPNANIIQDPVFERAIVKIHDGQQLTVEEIAHAQCFELPVTTVTTVESNAQDKSESFAEMALKRRRISSNVSTTSHYAGGRDSDRGRKPCYQRETDIPVQP